MVVLTSYVGFDIDYKCNVFRLWSSGLPAHLISKANLLYIFSQWYKFKGIVSLRCRWCPAIYVATSYKMSYNCKFLSDTLRKLILLAEYDSPMIHPTWSEYTCVVTIHLLAFRLQRNPVIQQKSSFQLSQQCTTLYPYLESHISLRCRFFSWAINLIDGPHCLADKQRQGGCRKESVLMLHVE